MCACAISYKSSNLFFFFNGYLISFKQTATSFLFSSQFANWFVFFFFSTNGVVERWFVNLLAVKRHAYNVPVRCVPRISKDRWKEGRNKRRLPTAGFRAEMGNKSRSIWHRIQCVLKKKKKLLGKRNVPKKTFISFGHPSPERGGENWHAQPSKEGNIKKKTKSQ